MKTYVKFGEEGSDVHVFQLGASHFCERCRLLDDETAYEAMSVLAMREHLRNHLQVGHKVGAALLRLLRIEGTPARPEGSDVEAAEVAALEKVINSQLPELHHRVLELERVVPAVARAIAVLRDQLERGPTPQRLNKDVLKEVLAILEGAR